MSLEKKDTSLADKINSIVSAVPETFDPDEDDDEARARLIDKLLDTDSDDERLISAIRAANVEFLDQGDSKYRGIHVSREELYGECDSTDNSDDDEKPPDNEEPSKVDDKDEKKDVDDQENAADTVPDDKDDGGGDLSEDEAASGAEAASGDEATSNEAVSDNEAASDYEIDSADDGTTSEDGEVDEDNPLYRNRKKMDNITTMTPSNLKRDAEKGECVRQQLKLWENFLEIRIQMQKCLVVSNKMPQFDVHKDYMTDKDLSKAQSEAKNKLSALLDNLLGVQEKLLKNHPETKDLLTEGKPENEKEQEDDAMDEEIPSDSDDEMAEEKEAEEDEEPSDEPPKKKQKRTLADYEKILDKNHKKFTPYRNSVIQKWNDKTRVASGKMDKSTAQPIVKQIDYLLSDKNKLVRKTQLKRSEYKIIGKKSSDEPDEDGRKTQEYDAEIYDDDDFYHQLLRELIEQKSADITDPVQLSKQWIQLQNLRNKMKKKVDTRATKGRRLRYNVHTKLVNFMAPMTVNDTWSDQAKTELYNSLFGKIKPVEDKSTSEINGNNEN